MKNSKVLLAPNLNTFSAPEYFYRLPKAKVVIADYDLLRQDFPELAHRSAAAVNRWLLQNSAFVSRPQTKPNDIFKPFPFQSQKPVIGFRPPMYGRAAVFPIPANEDSARFLLQKLMKSKSRSDSAKSLLARLFLQHLEMQRPKATSHNLRLQGLDIKGVGSYMTPTNESHSSGVLYLADALREYVMERVLRQILTAPEFKDEWRTIKTYAVLSSGLVHRHRLGKNFHCGLLVRQVHDRPLYLKTGHVLLGRKALALEKKLRRYGVSSSGGKRAGLAYDPINIQISKNSQLIDFGSYIFLKKSDRDLRLPTENKLGHKMIPLREFRSLPVKTEILLKNPQHFAQDTSVNDSSSDNLYALCTNLAKAFIKGQISSRTLGRSLSEHCRFSF